MGGREQNILRASQERGDPVPSEIANRPELWPICEPIWEAFWTLAQSRPIVSMGMGATHGHLTYESKSAYAKDHGFADSTDDLDDFLHAISAMDSEWLKLNAPRKSSKTK